MLMTIQSLTISWIKVHFRWFAYVKCAQTRCISSQLVLHLYPITLFNHGRWYPCCSQSAFAHRVQDWLFSVEVSWNRTALCKWSNKTRSLCFTLQATLQRIWACNTSRVCFRRLSELDWQRIFGSFGSVLCFHKKRAALRTVKITWINSPDVVSWRQLSWLPIPFKWCRIDLPAKPRQSTHPLVSRCFPLMCCLIN